MTDPSQSIPHSPVLSEASSDSLQHLFSIDPEQYSKQNLDAIIAEMRALRDRLAATTESRPTRTKSAPIPQSAAVNPEDLGL